MSALYLGYAVLAAYARQTSAVSREAGVVSKAASAVISQREGSESLFGQKAASLSKLQSAVVAIVADDEQDAVEPRTFRNARQFLLALPDDLPAPEFGIDPDGAISLDWTPARNRMFSVSISASERLAYAWLDGSDRGHAVARFRYPGVPASLLDQLKSVLADEIVGLRAA